ncbi:MAG: heat-shock protein [Mariprofundaceae bacterium]|nr:heat-shock protein [Mariprofundaceae bacterium]
MTALLFILLVGGLLFVWVLFWRQWQDDDELPNIEHDERISPLLRGINYLLTDEPDLALQEMVQVAKLRSEAADVYMALGEMFRSHGEIGRAVRIHQNILARPDVSPELYLQAHFALAKDFQTGGLLDRALRHYQKVLDVRSDHLNALTASLRIREQSSEWLKAEELLSRIERLEGDEDGLHRAYLWCAMAQDALQNEQYNVAQEYINNALDLAKNCGHAYILLVELALKKHDVEKLKHTLSVMQRETPDYLHLLTPLLLQSDACADELMVYWQEQHDHELALAWMEEIAKHDVHAAICLREKMSFVPAGLRESLRLAAMDMNSDEFFVEQAKKWRVTMKHYSCTQCGVQTVDMRWQCPQCNQWGSMSAITEGDKLTKGVVGI